MLGTVLSSQWSYASSSVTTPSHMMWQEPLKAFLADATAAAAEQLLTGSHRAATRLARQELDFVASTPLYFSGNLLRPDGRLAPVGKSSGFCAGQAHGFPDYVGPAVEGRNLSCGNSNWQLAGAYYGQINEAIYDENRAAAVRRVFRDSRYGDTADSFVLFAAAQHSREYLHEPPLHAATLSAPDSKTRTGAFKEFRGEISPPQLTNLQDASGDVTSNVECTLLQNTTDINVTNRKNFCNATCTNTVTANKHVPCGNGNRYFWTQTWLSSIRSNAWMDCFGW